MSPENSRSSVSRVLSFAAMALAGVFLSVGAAHADCCISQVVTAVNQADNHIVGQLQTNGNNNINGFNNILTQIQTTDNDIVNALKMLSGQQTVNSQNLIQGNGSIATTQDARRVQMQIQDKTFEAMNGAASGSAACNVITGTVAGQTLYTDVAAFREQEQQALVDYDLGGVQSASHNGQMAARQALISAHCKYQPTQSDLDSGLCPAGTQLKPASNLPGAAGQIANDTPEDVNAGIFMTPQNEVMAPDQQQAARLFIAHAFTPSPMGPLAPGAANTLAGKQLALQHFSHAALGSIAGAAVSDIMARRTPFADQSTSVSTGSGKTSLSAWAEGTADQTLGYAKTNGRYFPNGISYDGLLELRSRAWYQNPTWGVALNTGTGIQAVKDLAEIEAFRAMQDNEIYKQAENTNVLLAAIVTMMREKQPGQVAPGATP